MEHLSHITAPVAIYYGNKDDSLYEKRAHFIYENVSSSDKKLKAFQNSTHLMTLGKDKELLFKEVVSFINLYMNITYPNNALGAKNQCD